MVIQCLHYNYNNSDTTCTDSYDKCAKQVNCPELDHQCFVVWQTVPNVTILSAGCIKPLDQVVDGKCGRECIGQPRGPRYYCCCTDNVCNSNFRLPPLPSAEPAKPETENTGGTRSSHNVLWTVIPILMLITILMAYIHRHRKNNSTQNRLNRIKVGGDGNPNPSELDELRNHRDHSNISILMPFRNVFEHLNHDQSARHHLNQSHARTYFTTHDANNFRQPHFHEQNSSNNDNSNVRIDLNSVKMIEPIDSGRFGTVHKATLNELEVAVKIISANDYQTWLNERQIYSSPKIKHPNILNLFYSDEHLETESYWLILDYASKGSLYSFLRENTVTWQEFLSIALGIVHGLSHLHEEDIAHRDFKSKNILLKQDLVPCITDFGVATMLGTTNGSQLDHRRKYLQVGTPRYMAPEVLECSVTFTKASFTKIDVYALSLVLWELLTRCDPLPLPPGSEPTPAPPYKLPFEEFVGPQPDIKTMRHIVVVDKCRPSLKEEWHHYPISEVCRAIEDGWEYDYDARISASCFVERIESLPSSIPPK